MICPDCRGRGAYDVERWNDEGTRCRLIEYGCVECEGRGEVEADPLEDADMGPDVAPVGVSFVDVLRIAHEVGDVDADSIAIAVTSLRERAA